MYSYLKDCQVLQEKKLHFDDGESHYTSHVHGSLSNPIYIYIYTVRK